MLDARRIPQIAIVIVTFNSADVLGSCLAAIPDGADGVELTDVVVADNASTDESLQIAAGTTELPIRIVRMGRNAGYAAGINAGVAALGDRKPDAVLVINPDCQLMLGALAVLAEALFVDDRGIVAPKLLNPDGSVQPSLRRMPTVGRAFAEAVLGGKRAGRIRSLGELIFDEATHERPGPAAWVTGAALLISWQALVDTGPWDESFLLYSEETEFIFRAADHGWSTWYEPSAVVVHKGGVSGANPAFAALLAVNKVELYRRRHGYISSAAYRLAVLLGATVRTFAGHNSARAAMTALLRPSRRISSLGQLG